MGRRSRCLIESAAVLARLAPRRETETLTALAHLVRTRAAWFPGLPDRDGNVLLAAHSLGLAPADPAAEADLAFDALTAVFDGRVPDPTHGATHVHAHAESPAWARGLRATALIGPYLFLAPRGP